MTHANTVEDLVRVQAGLSEPTRQYLDRLHTGARAYVWGWQDATAGLTDSGGDDAEAFATAYTLHVARGMAGEITLTQPSYRIAYRHWRKGEPISTDSAF